jgi:hypothetical protein
VFFETERESLIVNKYGHWRRHDATRAYAFDDRELECVASVLVKVGAAHWACFRAPLTQADIVKAVMA